MFPYHDENQTERTPVVTIAIIALCVAVWILVQGAGNEYRVAETVCNYGLVAGELTGLAQPAGLVVLFLGSRMQTSTLSNLSSSLMRLARGRANQLEDADDIE